MKDKVWQKRSVLLNKEAVPRLSVWRETAAVYDEIIKSDHPIDWEARGFPARTSKPAQCMIENYTFVLKFLQARSGAALWPAA